MESIVELELEQMHNRLSKIASTNGGKHRMERFFQPSLMNVLWTMMAAKRYEHDDPKLARLLEINSAWFQSGNFGAGVVTAFPFLRYMLKEWTGYNNQMEGNKNLHQFLRVADNLLN